MINYRRTVQNAQRMLRDGHVASLVQLIQNFQQGLAMLQFAVAENELEAGFLPATTLDTLLLVRQMLCDQGCVRLLHMEELNTVWYVDKVLSRSYEERTPLELVIHRFLETVAA